jgi:hypothetical protein
MDDQLLRSASPGGLATVRSVRILRVLGLSTQCLQEQNQASVSSPLLGAREESRSRLADDSLAAVVLSRSPIAAVDPAHAFTFKGGTSSFNSWFDSAVYPTLGGASSGRRLARTASDVITIRHSSAVIWPEAKDSTCRPADCKPLARSSQQWVISEKCRLTTASQF